jgi:DsbC/DsbD-like thiol-disulfide interchange protein
MPAEFEFTLPDGVTLGQAQWPAPHEVTLFGEREQVYEGRIVVRIPFTATQAGALPVVGTLFAQACTDDSCHMVEQAFATTLQVNG